MPDQLLLPGFAPPPARPSRRCLWASELQRVHQLHADERARDHQRFAGEIQRLADALNDMRYRLLDVERALGAADLRERPQSRAGLRAYAQS
jgi:hypothetical protein